jgi:hypothetical protein
MCDRCISSSKEKKNVACENEKKRKELKRNIKKRIEIDNGY